MKKATSGFTYIEMIVVMTVIALLAAIGITQYPGVSRTGRDTQRKNDLRQYQTALEAFANHTPTFLSGSTLGDTALPDNRQLQQAEPAAAKGASFWTKNTKCDQHNNNPKTPNCWFIFLQPPKSILPICHTFAVNTFALNNI